MTRFGDFSPYSVISQKFLEIYWGFIQYLPKFWTYFANVCSNWANFHCYKWPNVVQIMWASGHTVCKPTWSFTFAYVRVQWISGPTLQSVWPHCEKKLDQIIPKVTQTIPTAVFTKVCCFSLITLKIDQTGHTGYNNHERTK